MRPFYSTRTRDRHLCRVIDCSLSLDLHQSNYGSFEQLQQNKLIRRVFMSVSVMLSRVHV